MAIELDVNNDGAVDISRGGTGGTTALAARANLLVTEEVEAYGDLNRAVSALSGGSPVTLTFSTNQILTGNLTIPSHIELVRLNGATITTTGYTLTINSSFTASNQQVFTGTGAVTSLKEARPEWFGGAADGVTNSTAAINAAIVAVTSISGGTLGGIVQLSGGIYLIDSTITLPNRVGLKGINSRATMIALHDDWSGNYMFHAVNGTSSMFDSWLRDMYLDARGETLTAVIWAQAWQEKSGLDNVVIQFDGATQTGLLISDGYGGAASLAIKNTEIFADTTYATDSGITVNQISVAGGFVLDLQHVTISGSTANPLSSAIVMDNDTLRASALHVENCATGITMSGYGSLRGDLITGSPNGVVDLITLGSGFVGKINLSNVLSNGATGQIINNNATGVDIPVSVGALPSYVYPAILSENTALAWVTFTGDTAGADPLALTILDSYNVASVTRTAAGTYIISFSRNMPAATRVVTGSIATDTADGYWITALGGSTASETITVRRGGAFSGALYSAQTVKVVIFGTQVMN